MTYCKNLTIFEGPDGAGKTRTARELADRTGAVYVHFPALQEVTLGLGRMYVEAMLPALLGYQPVVFDRSWLSEVPYGRVFRGGLDRLGAATCRMLERLAMRCGAVVVQCQPPLETCLENFNRRRHEEMLEREQQLKDVYHLYLETRTSLSRVMFDYTNTLQDEQMLEDSVGELQMILHHTKVRTAGNLSAKVLLVGEKFANHKDQDSFYQWPFASFSGMGCSRWLTDQLEEAGITEDQLCWVNADEVGQLLLYELMPKQTVVALGATASVMMEKFNIQHQQVDHPQAHKRFHTKDPYPLIPLLKEVLQ